MKRKRENSSQGNPTHTRNLTRPRLWFRQNTRLSIPPLLRKSFHDLWPDGAEQTTRSDRANRPINKHAHAEFRREPELCWLKVRINISSWCDGILTTAHAYSMRPAESHCEGQLICMNEREREGRRCCLGTMNSKVARGYRPPGGQSPLNYLWLHTTDSDGVDKW